MYSKIDHLINCLDTRTTARPNMISLNSHSSNLRFINMSCKKKHIRATRAPILKASHLSYVDFVLKNFSHIKSTRSTKKINSIQSFILLNYKILKKIFFYNEKHFLHLGSYASLPPTRFTESFFTILAVKGASLPHLTHIAHE